MSDFWFSCGHHLTDRGAEGQLLVSDEFLKAYLARPELRPPADACGAECALYAGVLADPRRPIGAAAIAAMRDADARENWQLMTAFRDRLIQHRTLEEAYRALVRQNIGGMPPLFLNHLVHAILRNALDGCDDPFVLRAAELFFRPQRVTVHQGALLAADEETVAGIDAVPMLPLVSMLGLPAGPQIDVLTDENAYSYWERSDRFDMALDLSVGRRGPAALATAIEIWIRHMLGIDVTIETLREMRDVQLTWYVGLDADATRLGDALWHGAMLDENDRRGVAALYRLTFADPRVVAPRFEGDAVYLILAIAPDGMLRMKPQNLLIGLPIGEAAVS